MIRGEEDENEEIILMVDLKLKKPGCVLIQAAYGFGASNTFLQETFENWLLAPTDDMRAVRGSKKQWRALAKAHDKS